MSAERDSYAYFSITTSLPLRDIEDRMGRVGEGRCWSNGDQRKLPAKGHYRFSSWSLPSGVDRGIPIDEHLEALWHRLSEHRTEILKLPESMSCRISCVAHFKTHHDNVSIASGHFSTAAYYRLSLDFDFYFDDSFGHEDEGKPYWAW